MCLRRGENPCGKGRRGIQRFLFFLRLSPRKRRNAPNERQRQREKRRTKRRERKMRTSEWANTRARGGCCCCGRGITSAPLTRKTFRLNLVLDSARLLSTHPNRTAFLARPKRSANPFPFPLPPIHPYFTSATRPLSDRRRTAGTRCAVCIWLHFEVININSGTVNDRGRACRRGDALCSPPLTPRYNHARRCSLFFPPSFSHLSVSFPLVL